MPFIERNEENKIIGIFTASQYEGQEFVEGPVELEVSTPSYPSEAVLQSPNGTPFKITVDDDGKIESEHMSEGA